MPTLISKIGIGRIMFGLLYCSMAFFAVTGDNVFDIVYFISLSIYLLRVLYYFRKKKRMDT